MQLWTKQVYDWNNFIEFFLLDPAFANWLTAMTYPYSDKTEQPTEPVLQNTLQHHVCSFCLTKNW